MRILDPKALKVDMTKLGFRQPDLEKFEETIHSPVRHYPGNRADRIG